MTTPADETPLPVTLGDATGVPYYRQITDQVADLICSGRLTPGAPLPSVRALAGQLLVSLITTRRAYADLEAAGLVTSRQGQGTFVADDVARISRRVARDRARAALAQAVARARALGLTSEEVLAHVRTLFDGGAHGER
jgi:GntR family transcriptional regulator